MKEALEEEFKKKIANNLLEMYEKGFAEGAKWQQERSYSELELRDICKKYVWFIQSKRPLYKEQLEWFEQFSKLKNYVQIQ